MPLLYLKHSNIDSVLVPASKAECNKKSMRRTRLKTFSPFDILTFVDNILSRKEILIRKYSTYLSFWNFLSITCAIC